MDIGAYAERGFYARAGWKENTSPPPERFTADTWVQRDICDREPFPFTDDQFDFVVCSHTLEDIRDPVAVCREISRIGKAGYIEVPSRLEEQSWGATGPFVGHHHHHWLTNKTDTGLEFIFKPHDLHSTPAWYFPAGFWDTLTEDERVLSLWWEDSFTARERVLFFEGGDDYVAELVNREMAARGITRPGPGLLQRVRRRLARRRPR